MAARGVALHRIGYTTSSHASQPAPVAPACLDACLPSLPRLQAASTSCSPEWPARVPWFASRLMENRSVRPKRSRNPRVVSASKLYW